MAEIKTDDCPENVRTKLDLFVWTLLDKFVLGADDETTEWFMKTIIKPNGCAFPYKSPVLLLGTYSQTNCLAYWRENVLPKKKQVISLYYKIKELEETQLKEVPTIKQQIALINTNMNELKRLK